MNRRNFIKNTSIATIAAASGISVSKLTAGESTAPVRTKDSPLRIGLIGCGWYGMVDAKAALQAGGVEITAVADVDSEHLSQSINELKSLQGSLPKGFKDYRELLDSSTLDAVIIGTPPHWHALQFIAVCEKGLPIYCEKPLAYDLEEGKAMVHAAKKAGNIVQIGFQRRQNEVFRKVGEIINDGKIGKVLQIGAQIHYHPGNMDTTIQDPPASLDWDAWCGPAPKLPYRPSIGHRAWRLEKEYGNGHLVDWGIHHIDIIRKIMGFAMPDTIEASGGIYLLKERVTTPDTLIAKMQFNGIPVIWQHRLWGTGDLDPQFNNGVIFYGDKGTLIASDTRIVLIPAGGDKKQEIIEMPAVDMQEKHVAEFIKAVKTGNNNLISCSPEDGFQSTASVQLAMIAYETGSKLNWDRKANRIIKNPEAGKLQSRPYRKGYKRPVV